MNFKDRLIRFFYGRNGFDQLTYFVFALYILSAVVDLFVKAYWMQGVMLLFAAYMVFRVLSRNLSKRRAENAKFLTIWNKISPPFLLQYKRLKEIKTRRYRTCPHCKAVIRLPRKKGTHTVTCPRCKRDFSVKIRF